MTIADKMVTDSRYAQRMLEAEGLDLDQQALALLLITDPGFRGMAEGLRTVTAHMPGDEQDMLCEPVIECYARSRLAGVVPFERVRDLGTVWFCTWAWTTTPLNNDKEA